MYHNAGVLITGGGGTEYQAELYVPSTGESCTLPLLPDWRLDHTVSKDGLLCGGDNALTVDVCIMWSSDSGTWEEALILDVWREAHVSWTPFSGNTST